MVNTRGGGDSPFLLQRTLDMAENLRHGIFPPRWMAHAAYDLGYPFFSHYAALPYVLSGGLTALGLGPILAIQATQTFGFVLAALTMALWASRIFESRAAVLVAVVAYTFAPFHLVNVYVRGDSLSEFYAFVWYPLILWTLDRLVESPARGRIVAAALAYGALILTHNVSAMIFSPFALLYAAARISESVNQQVIESANQRISESANRPPTKPPNCLPPAPCILHPASRILPPASCLLLPFLLGFLLTAWFWMPALLETGYGQMGPEFTAGYFHYSNHFRGLNLVQPSFAFNYSVALRTEDGGPFSMGMVQAVLLVVGAVVLIVRSPQSAVQSRKSKVESPKSRFTFHVSHLYLLSGLLLSTLMITPFSKPLWDHLPLLEITQFPWRFLSVQALFTAMATGAIANLKILKSQNLKVLVAVVLCVLLIVAALAGLRPERLLISGEDVTWETLRFYEAFTGNIGTTIRHEYLPRDVVPRLYTSEAVVDGVLRLIVDGGSLQAWELLERSPVKQVWRVTLASGDVPVAFPLNWWPGWQADVDGAPVAAYPITGSGRLAVDLFAGEHTITLRLRNTPLRTASEAMSVIALVSVGVWLVFGRKSKVQSPKSEAGNPKSKIQNPKSKAICYLLFAICILALSIALPALFQRAPTSAAFFDFSQMPYPHAGAVDFGAAQLGGVMLSTDTVRPGDTLTVVHDWQLSAPTQLTGTLRLVSPAEPRHNVPYALAEVTFSLPCAGSCETILAVPDDIARGFYLVELRLYGVNGELTPRTSRGSGMGTLYVGSVRVPNGPTLPDDAPVLATFTDLTLHTVEPQQPDSTTLRLKMAWSTPGTPRNWSLSLRLLDVTGRLIVQRDLQPGYGYLPTTLWLPGELVVDYPVLPLPEGLAPGDYTLQIVTYLLATMEGGGQIDIPIALTAVTYYDLRDACCEQTRKGATILCQAKGLALLSTDLPSQLTEGHDLDFHAEWNALDTPTVDMAVLWEFASPEGNAIGTTEGPIAAGARPSAWPRHAWVRAPVHIDLPPVLRQGDYDLRLTLLDGDAALTTCTFPSRMTVVPRPRLFEVPALDHPQMADFGDEISLLGYDLAQESGGLTLWWQAQTAPSRDYKRFVHLYDPATEVIAAQDDAMPRAWSYPTSWWAAGEVVSETLTLDVHAVAAGDYRLGVGWYDPETLTRLPATDAAGQPQPAERVTLDALVTLKH